ncbi:MAG: methionine--tRNA ligase [Bacteroidia bacterium]|nr:methionine--tRNA ligase [Bacteroidia bacterium]
MNTRYTVTAALPYANGPLHIGHLSGVYIPADIYVRFLRSNEQDVLFICGSDEHGVAITIKAKQQGTTPQELVNHYHEILKKTFQDFDISVNIYHRTSDKIHHETAQAFFQKFYNEGKLDVQTSLQYYDEQEQIFLADRYIIGTCPRCQNTNAYGDQCEQCGSTLASNDLINPRSALSGITPVLKETKHWFLPLDHYQKFMEEWILNQHQDWKPNVYGQCKSWLSEGLKARAITRDMDWGIKPAVPDSEGKVLYVWFDAPIGYISATKAWALQQGKPEEWKKYWLKNQPEGESKLIHFIGKDNIVFHCIIFPIILLGHGEYILPENVPANEFLNLEGQKISTSRNWAVWAHEFYEQFPEKTDVMRYVLTAIMPETKDSDFTWQDFQARNNNELVGILGNFINRVMVITHRNFNGQVPDAPLNESLLAVIQNKEAELTQSMQEYRFREALQAMMAIAREGNRYLTETEPWKLLKTKPAEAAKVIRTCLEITARLTIVMEPFLPKTANTLTQMLAIPKPMNWKNLQDLILLKPETTLNPAKLLFEKIEDSVILEQEQYLKKKLEKPLPPVHPPVENSIPIEYFQQIDLRVGQIIAAERIPKATKLLKLTVDIGYEKRTIVSGIAEHYAPESLINQKVAVVANLVPKNIRGIESKGMILMAENPNGQLFLVSPEAIQGSIIR